MEEVSFLFKGLLCPSQWPVGCWLWRKISRCQVDDNVNVNVNDNDNNNNNNDDDDDEPSGRSETDRASQAEGQAVRGRSGCLVI
jgi:hypothetical protein